MMPNLGSGITMFVVCFLCFDPRLDTIFATMRIYSEYEWANLITGPRGEHMRTRVLDRSIK